MNEELNKKLAEWAGIRYEPDQDVFKVIFPDGSWYNIGHDWALDDIEPDFPNDLNACFKWLVPKASKTNEIIITIPPNTERRFLVQIGHQDRIEAETPTLALCKAIEQLINKGE